MWLTMDQVGPVLGTLLLPVCAHHFALLWFLLMRMLYMLMKAISKTMEATSCMEANERGRCLLNPIARFLAQIVVTILSR